MIDEIATVTENRFLGGGHFLLSLESPRQAAAARPGQFAMLRLLGHSDVILRRPMSIYDIKENGAGAGAPTILQFLYKVVGRGTRLMSALKPGDSVGLLAPLGHGFFESEYLNTAKASAKVLHVAGGIGIAALLLPAKALARHRIPQRLFFGGRTLADLAGREDFEPLTGPVILATEDGSAGHRGYVTKPLEDYLERHRSKKFLMMACGPWGMLQAVAKMAREYNQACLVSMENRMGCGLGACLGCSIRVNGAGHGMYERVCTEGPVFWAEHVVWPM